MSALARRQKDDSIMSNHDTLAEKMNRGMGLDPAFTLDKPSLASAVHAETDATVVRAQAAVDQQRANAADIEKISKEMEREAKAAALHKASEAAAANDEA
jgi:hypothetical protein